MKLGIYGGTFSPIHNAHVRAAELFLRECCLDELLIIPTRVPPHKQIDGDDDPMQRYEMCRVAFSGIPEIKVSDIEIKRSGKSYTVMTVRELEREDRELFFLCGTDMILTFDKWFCFEEIMAKCTLVYIRRESNEDLGARLAEKIKHYKEKYNAKIIGISAPAIELSSTDVRELIAAGADAAGLIPPRVLDYINEHGLYKNNEKND